MNGTPTAKQRSFQSWCRDEYGCVVSGLNADSIHHIKGSKMPLKGCNKPGEWYVLPISYWWHQDGDNKAAIHVNRKEFALKTNKTEKEWWVKLIADYEEFTGKKPMSEEEYKIILESA